MNAKVLGILLLQCVIPHVQMFEKWDLDRKTTNGSFYEQHHFFVAAYYPPDSDKNLICGYVSFKVEGYAKNEVIIELPTEILTKFIGFCDPVFFNSMCFFNFEDSGWMVIASERESFGPLLLKKDRHMDEKESRTKLKEFLDSPGDYKRRLSLEDFTFANRSCQRVPYLWIVIVLVFLAVVALVLILFGGKIQERLNSNTEEW